MGIDKLFGIVMFFLVIGVTLAGLAAAQQSELVIDEVQVDDVTVYENEVNRLDVERNQEIEVEVHITALADVDDVEVEAFISGYEYNDFDRMSDTTHVFDADANVRYVKKLKLSIPDDVDEDDYRLRVLVSNRGGIEILQNYNLKIDVPRHSMKIEDVMLSPSGTVYAGRALLATVRVDNRGEKDEDDVKVTVSIPDLGVSASSYIDEIEEDEEEETEQMFLRIPNCAEAGQYLLNIDVEYDRRYERISTVETVYVVADSDVCEIPSDDDKPKTVITLGSQSESMIQGGESVFYQLTLTNSGKTAKAYSVRVRGLGDFGTAKITPSSTVVVDGGKSQSLFIFVSANEDAAPGPHIFTADVTSGSETLQQITYTANVVEANASGWQIAKKVLEVALVVLVIVLIIVGLVIGFRKMGGDEDSGEESNTYY